MNRDTYTLTYAELTESSNGQISLSNAETLSDLEGQPGQFDTEQEAIDCLIDLMGDWEPGSTVKDVTEAEGFTGWGTVLRVSGEEADKLYSVKVS